MTIFIQVLHAQHHLHNILCDYIDRLTDMELWERILLHADYCKSIWQSKIIQAPMLVG